MTETVLRHAAVRAAYEIAGMLQETSALMAYAAEVAATDASEPLRAAMAAVETGPPAGLHLAGHGFLFKSSGRA